MLERYITASNIIELIEESSSDDKTSHKAIIRVVGPERAWSGLMLEVLRVPEEGSDFIVSVRKEYFLSDENKPSFVWVLMIWGDLLQAFSEIGPVLQARKTHKTPRKSPAVGKGGASSPKAKGSHTVVTESVSTIPLPFRRGNRNDPGVTRSLSNRKGVGAFVSTIQDGGM